MVAPGSSVLQLFFKRKTLISPNMFLLPDPPATTKKPTTVGYVQPETERPLYTHVPGIILIVSLSSALVLLLIYCFWKPGFVVWRMSALRNTACCYVLGSQGQSRRRGHFSRITEEIRRNKVNVCESKFRPSS